jgi:predicted TIM-barrel fold metal-dependent hydrolase
MIIDCHTHVFQHWDGLCGHESQEVHWKYIQKNVTRPSSKVRRAKDGAPADAKGLFRAGDNSWTGLRDDVKFRVGSYGRVEFTLNGEDYYIQYMPVGMAEIEAPPELQLAQMSYAGVDHSVLQAGMSYGMMNDYNAFCQHQYPDKFSGLFHVDEPKADTPRWMKEMERARQHLGLRGIYYQLDGFSRYGFQWAFDDPRFDGFWETLSSLRIPVFFECSNMPNYDEKSYIMYIMGESGRAMARTGLRMMPTFPLSPLIIRDAASYVVSPSLPRSRSHSRACAAPRRAAW